ncbi:unnamed protein product, partial [Prorocentrum cordatum]
GGRELLARRAPCACGSEVCGAGQLCDELVGACGAPNRRLQPRKKTDTSTSATTTSSFATTSLTTDTTTFATTSLTTVTTTFVTTSLTTVTTIAAQLCSIRWESPTPSPVPAPGDAVTVSVSSSASWDDTNYGISCTDQFGQPLNYIRAGNVSRETENVATVTYTCVLSDNTPVPLYCDGFVTDQPAPTPQNFLTRTVNVRDQVKLVDNRTYYAWYDECSSSGNRRRRSCKSPEDPALFGDDWADAKANSNCISDNDFHGDEDLVEFWFSDGTNQELDDTYSHTCSWCSTGSLPHTETVSYTCRRRSTTITREVVVMEQLRLTQVGPAASPQVVRTDSSVSWSDPGHECVNNANLQLDAAIFGDVSPSTYDRSSAGTTTISYDCRRRTGDMSSEPSGTRQVIIRDAIELHGDNPDVKRTSDDVNDLWQDPGSDCIDIDGTNYDTLLWDAASSTWSNTIAVSRNIGQTFTVTYRCQAPTPTPDVTRVVEITSPLSLVGSSTQTILIQNEFGAPSTWTDKGANCITPSGSPSPAPPDPAHIERSWEDTITVSYTCAGVPSPAYRHVEVKYPIQITTSNPTVLLQAGKFGAPSSWTPSTASADVTCIYYEEDILASPVSTSLTVSATPTSLDRSAIGSFTVTYSCEYNSYTSTRSLQVRVRNPIELIGGSQLKELADGGDWADPGADCIDLSGSAVNWTSTGDVDLTAAGTFYVTYSCTSAGDTQQLVRQVDVYTSQLTLYGNSPLVIQQYRSFSDPGALCLESDGTSSVVVSSSSVDTSTIATTQLPYTCTADGATHTATRTVVITDGNPQCKLRGSSVFVLAEGETFEDPKACCLDQAGQFLGWGTAVGPAASAWSTLEPGPHVVAYACARSGFATDTEQRTVIVNHSPEIYLTGPAHLRVMENSNYVDEGAMCADAEDGLISTWGSDGLGIVGLLPIYRAGADASGVTAGAVESAFDGDTDDTASDCNCVQIAASEVLWLDLGAARVVHSFRLYGAIAAGTVAVGNTQTSGGVTCATGVAASAGSPTAETECSAPLAGRYVQIAAGSGAMTVCEVLLYGTVGPAAPATLSLSIDTSCCSDCTGHAHRFAGGRGLAMAVRGVLLLLMVTLCRGQALQMAAARLQRGRKAMEAAEQQWKRAKQELERCTEKLRACATEVMKAEREDIAKAKEFLPPGELPVPRGAVLDIREVLDGNLELEISLGVDLDGLGLAQSDHDILEKTKSELQVWSRKAVQDTHGQINEKLQDQKAKVPTQALRRLREERRRVLAEARQQTPPLAPRQLLGMSIRSRFKMPPPLQCWGTQDWGLESDEGPQQEDDGESTGEDDGKFGQRAAQGESVSQLLLETAPEAQDRLWRDLSASRSRGTPPRYMVDSKAFRLDPEASLSVGRSFAEWTVKFALRLPTLSGLRHPARQVQV